MTKIHHAVDIATSPENCFKALTDIEMMEGRHHSKAKGEDAPGVVLTLISLEKGLTRPELEDGRWDPSQPLCSAEWSAALHRLRGFVEAAR